MRRLLRRVGRVSPVEIRDRSLERFHTVTEAIAQTLGHERWDRRQLRSRLRTDVPALRGVAGAIASGDLAGAEAALRTHVIERPSGFVIRPGGRPQLVEAVVTRYPSAPEQAAARANDILCGRYDLLGYRALSFRTGRHEIDWQFDPVHQRRAPHRFWARVPFLDPASGDHKVIWELNRHQHWLALGRAAWLTGDSRYAVRFEQELASWLHANPPLVGINWASMLELAFRSISWIWAFHLFAEFRTDAARPTFIDLLLALDRQLDHVARHLSTYFSPNTHLLGEGLALYVAGRSLSELTSAPRWERLGRRILLRELRAQVHADGGHVELSTHYHRYALDFYMLALVVARRTGDATEAAFAETVARLAGFCRAMADGQGRLPTIGDDDGGVLFPICGRPPFDVEDSLALAAALLHRPELAVDGPPEEVLWMLSGEVPSSGSGQARSSRGSQLFPDTGYAVLRAGADRAVVDVGPHGFLNGGHAHADALSVILSLDGRDLLIDPGTSTYTMDPERRDRFRSTAMHNTVVIDRRPQSLAHGPFHWATRARAHLDAWRPGCGLVEAWHDGYLPLVHRRAVLRTPSGIWLVADHVLGSGRHEAHAYWHLSPSWTLDRHNAGLVALAHADGARAALATTAPEIHDFFGDAQGLGWCAPVYGQLEPAPTLRMSMSAGAPFTLLTGFAFGARSADLAVQEAEVASVVPDAWHVGGAVVSDRTAMTLVLLAVPLPGTAPDGPRGPRSLPGATGRFTTDARTAVLQCSLDGRPEALMTLDATFVEWTGAGAFRLTPRPGERDLHLEFDALRELSHPAAARPVG